MKTKKLSQKKYKLLEPMVLKYEGITFTIPKGFVTDGASIPFFLWWAWKPFGKDTLNASIIHDYLYHYQVLSRKTADYLYFDLMSIYEVALFKKWCFFFGVRLGGWVRFYLITNKL